MYCKDFERHMFKLWDYKKIVLLCERFCNTEYFLATQGSRELHWGSIDLHKIFPEQEEKVDWPWKKIVFWLGQKITCLTCITCISCIACTTLFWHALPVKIEIIENPNKNCWLTFRKFLTHLKGVTEGVYSVWVGGWMLNIHRNAVKGSRRAELKYTL